MIKILLQLTKFPPRYLNGAVVHVKEGYQSIWEKVAAANHVRLDSYIQQIRREQNKVIITVDKEHLIFDKIIFACCPDEIKNMMVMNDSEKDIFSDIEYCPLIRASFLASNLPHDAYYMIIDPEGKNPSHLLSFGVEANIDEKSSLYTCIMRMDKMHELSIESIKQTAVTFMQEHFDATNIQWVKLAAWPKYGAHFSLHAIKNGVYKKLSHIQGKNNTYYAGEIASYGLNALTANYSYYLIDKHF